MTKDLASRQRRAGEEKKRRFFACHGALYKGTTFTDTVVLSDTTALLVFHRCVAPLNLSPLYTHPVEEFQHEDPRPPAMPAIVLPPSPLGACHLV